jgi:hyperosmotically inducible periplasmic protein
MNHSRTLAIAALVGVTVATSGFITGCAVERGQETTGAYVDDTVITTEVKATFANDPAVAATSISVETLNGTVQLRGFAKSEQERSQAESLAHGVKGVRSVRNDIVVRP